MATSLFGVGEILNASADGTIVPQSFVGTGGQTVFNLTNFTYVPNTNSLSVFINGSRQVSGRDFQETSSTSFVLNEGVVAGDFVDAEGIVNTTITAQNAANTIVGGTYSVLNYINDNSLNVQAYPYLAQGNGITDDWASLSAAIAQEKISKVGLVFPGGTYIVSKTLAFLDAALRDVTFIALGKVIIKCTGTGPVITLDAGTTTSRCDNVNFVGDWVLQGNDAGTSTYGAYIRGFVHSFFKARALNVATAAFRVEWAVLSEFDLTCSANVDTFTTVPQYCLQVDQSSVGLYTADCRFNCRFESAAFAAIDYINGALGNRFIGTCESVLRGFIHEPTAGDCVLDRMDFEQNTIFDVSVAGRGLVMFGSNSASLPSGPNIQVLATATQIRFTDCVYLRQVDVDAAAVGVTISQCSLADNVSLGITGTGKGNVKIYGSSKVNSSGVWTSDYIDQLGFSGTWTPALSTGTGVQGAGTAVGTYNIIGKLCYLQGLISLLKGSLGAGVLSITGLPFSSRATANDVQYLQCCEWDNVTLGAGYTNLVLRLPNGNNVLTFVKSGSAVVSANPVLADFPATITMRFTGVVEMA